VAPNDLVIDLQHIETVKQILESIRQSGDLNLVEEAGHEPSIFHQLTVMKGLAETLNEAKMTIRIRRRGATVLVVGERAKPRLSRLVLGNNIQADILQITSLLRDLS
jgi:nucleotide-binding universal stress UspA family protein